MNTMKKTPRRDRCYFVGLRAAKLSPLQAARAWAHLAARLESLGKTDLPKFRDLLNAIRDATITAKQPAGGARSTVPH